MRANFSDPDEDEGIGNESGASSRSGTATTHINQNTPTTQRQFPFKWNWDSTMSSRRSVSFLIPSRPVNFYKYSYSFLNQNVYFDLFIEVI